MKRQLCQFGLLVAVTAALPAAVAQNPIVKCVDGAGRVTLTDMPCEPGTTTVRMSTTSSNEGVTRVEPYPMRVERAVLPPANALQRQHAGMEKALAKPLSSDVATLKAARAQFLLDDVGSRDALATLE